MPAATPAPAVEEAEPRPGWLRRLGWRIGDHTLALVILGLVLLFAFVYFVPDEFVFIYPGQAAILWHRFYNGQVMNSVYGEGTHIILPWDKMYVYNLRVHDLDDSVNLLTIDGLAVQVKLNVRVKLDVHNLPALNERLGPDYMTTVVKPQLESATRNVLSRYQAEQLHVHDEESLSNDIQSVLQAAPDMDLIGIQAVNIESIVLPPGLQASIEAKNEEEQKSLLYDYKLQEARKEAERKKIEAEGIEQFQDTLSHGLTNQYLIYRGIEATEALANSPNAKMVIINSDKNGLPLVMGGMMPGADTPAPAKK